MGDLKVANILMGLKSGYSKYPCLFCKFDSRIRYIDFNLNYNRDDRVEEDLPSLVRPSKVALPVLHIKLGLFQQFVKVLDESSPLFSYLLQNFPKTEAKMLPGILTGPEIRLLMNDPSFHCHLNEIQQAAWDSFVCVAKTVLEKNVADNWETNINKMIKKIQHLGCPRRSHKMHL